MRGNWKINWFYLCVSIRNNFCKWFYFKTFNFFLRHKNNSTSTIINFGSICSSDCSSFWEGWRELWNFTLIISFWFLILINLLISSLWFYNDWYNLFFINASLWCSNSSLITKFTILVLSLSCYFKIICCFLCT